MILPAVRSITEASLALSSSTLRHHRLLRSDGATIPHNWWHYAADHQAVGGNTMTTRIPSPNIATKLSQWSAMRSARASRGLLRQCSGSDGRTIGLRRRRPVPAQRIDKLRKCRMFVKHECS
jgi:hypothetical protein